MPPFQSALRRIFRQPMVPAAIVVILAVALGAVAAMFSIVDALVRNAAPYPASDRLVTAAIGGPQWSPAMLDALSGVNTTFELMAGVHERAVTLSGDAPPEVLRLEAVNASYFQMLGAHPVAGGPWTKDAEIATSGGAVALISGSLWQRRFEGDPRTLQREVRIDGTRVRIIGVLPDGFHGLVGRTDIWIPLRFATTVGASSRPPDRPWSRWFEVIGRIPSDRSLERSRASFELDARRAMSALPGADRALGNRWRATLRPLALDRGDRRLARAATLLLGAVLFVLVLACVALAGLQLVSVLGRAREFAIRTAIGGSPRTIAALLGTETGLIVLAGCAGALLSRRWILTAILALRPPPTGFGIGSAEVLSQQATALGAGSLGAILAAGVLSWLAIGSLSFAVMSRWDFVTQLRSATGGSSALSLSRPGGRAAALLVAAEIALSVVLLCGAGLMGRTAANLWLQDRGFEPADITTIRVQRPPLRYNDAALPNLHARLIERLAAVPGVEAVSISNCIPGTGRCRQTNVRQIDGRLLGAAAPTVGVHYVTPAHFTVLAVPVLRGRNFDPRDLVSAVPTVIVNQSAAARLWPDQEPVGRRLALFFASGVNTEEREVVGVVGNVSFDPREMQARPDVFLPAAQVSWGSPALFVKQSDRRAPTAEALRAAIAEVDPELAVQDMASLSARLGVGFATERLLMAVLLTLAIAALTLAAVGVYGLVAQAVAQELREVGIRMALGASRSRIVGMLAGRAGSLLSVGLIAGVSTALFTGRFLSAFLFGIQPRDPVTLVGIAVLVIVVIAAALAGPLRRASRVDPVTILRAD